MVIALHSIEDQLILHEGMMLSPYICPAGYWTIGVGRNLKSKGLNDAEQQAIFNETGLPYSKTLMRLQQKGITKDQAMLLLRNDIAECESDLKRYRWFEGLDPVRRKVVIDMRFNLGSAGFKQFKRMIKHLEQGCYTLAAGEMINSRWYCQVYTRGKRLVEMMRTGSDY